MRNIVVVGGGTAGWLTALYLKKIHVDFNVIVVKSDKIGILGAGEGSTPHLIDFIKLLDISEYELIRNTNATYKLGINFENWHGDDTSYFHGFGLSDQYKDIHPVINSNLMPSVVALGEHFDQYYLPYQLASKKKSPFVQANRHLDVDVEQYENNFDYRINHIMNNYDWTTSYSLHFDAVELARYFEQIAKEREIIVIDGVVDDICLDDNGFIDYIILGDTGTRINTDFIFDCTGFHRLITDKVYNSNWVSFSDYLPMKQAQPFFLPPDDDLHPWTQAIAQESGWIWKIPLQHRYGCGYVYDTDYITNEEVRDVIQKQYPSAAIPDRTFKFNPGYFETPLNKNSFAIGLAGGFVEPLEATSIFSFIEQLQILVSSNILSLILNKEARNNCELSISKATATINEKCAHVNQDIAYFIQLHYLTERNDTQFWREYRTKCKRFEYVDARIELLNYGDINHAYPISSHSPLFSNESWNVVGHGLRHIKSIQPYLDNINLDNLKRSVDLTAEKFVSQRVIIDHCKS